MYLHWGILRKKGLIPVNFIRRKNINSKIQENKQSIEKNLYSYAFLTTEELFAHLSTTQAGFTSKESESRQEEFGQNIITSGNKNSTLHRLREAVANPFNIIICFMMYLLMFHC